METIHLSIDAFKPDGSDCTIVELNTLLEAFRHAADELGMVISERGSIPVYVAGPFSGDEEANTNKAIDAGEELARLGFRPYIPHISLLWERRHHHELSFWYRLGLEWVRVSRALLRLPGPSTGADAEVLRAMELGIPVFYNIPDLVAWWDGQLRVCPMRGGGMSV